MCRPFLPVLLLLVFQHYYAQAPAGPVQQPPLSPPLTHYSLLIRNGCLIDPKNERQDTLYIAIRNDRIARIARHIDPGTADRVIGLAPSPISRSSTSAKGTLPFTDHSGHSIEGTQKLECSATIRAGRVVFSHKVR